MASLVQDYLARTASEFPSRLAAECGHDSLTFAQWDAASNRLARFLKSMGLVRGDRVAFCLPKSIHALVAMVAIAKADAIYVPLNAFSPRARISTVIEDASPRVILFNDSTKGLVGSPEGAVNPVLRLRGRGFGAPRFETQKMHSFPLLSAGFPAWYGVNLDTNDSLIARESSGSLVYENTGEDVCYILYTSGSTGNPKGVMIRHRNIINATDWAVEEFGIGAKDRMSQHPPLYFDLSVFDVYCAMKSGASLFMVSDGVSLFPAQLVKFIEEKGLTIWNSVPSAMVAMCHAGAVSEGRMPSLKKIFFNGEGFPSRFLARWMSAYPEKTFVNMYGPTETTVQCTFYRIPEPPRASSSFVPIGTACRGVEVFAVREDGSIAQPGEAGELYVGGRGVGAGYWNDPAKTARAFVAHPFDSDKGIMYRTGDLVRRREDGNYEFIGRKDNQVKIRGNRIELGDVDAALWSLPYVNAAAAIAVEDEASGGNKLLACVDMDDANVRSIKDDLAALIPAYMIPDEVIRTKLPKTSTGKIDRAVLQERYGRKN